MMKQPNSWISARRRLQQAAMSATEAEQIRPETQTIKPSLSSYSKE